MKKILVVDDDPGVLFTVKQVLGKEGYETRGAPGGAKALEMMREDVPDLVLLDIMMPDMDGWDVLKEIRSDSLIKSVPVAMLTAKSFSESTVKKRDLKGLLEHVVKPFTREKMTDVQLINRGTSFFWIDKPFSRHELLKKVETIFECVR